MNKDMFGRKWSIQFVDAEGTQIYNIADSTDHDKSLRCTFSVEQELGACPWYAQLQIWNLVGDSQQNLFYEASKRGCRVIIQAGYEQGSHECKTIFSGEVFQPLFDRINVTDHIVTLSCIDMLGFHSPNICSLILAGGTYDYGQIIRQMAANSYTGAKVGYISDSLSKKKFPRSKTFFGDIKKYMNDIARDNQAFWYAEDGKLKLTVIDDEYKGTPIKLTPTNGLIGTPQQTANGVTFRTLLDPRLKVQAPPTVVELNMGIIRQQKIHFDITQKNYVSYLDKDFKYKVVKAVFHGDTRGNNWYTDVYAVNTVGKVSALLGLVKNG